MRSGYAPVNGLDLYYEIHGTGPPITVLHGSLMTIDLMSEFIDGLARTRQVLAVEFQGHGRTADIDRPLRFEFLADDVAALLDHLEIGTADLFGYSTGGGVALQIAIRHPTRVRRLVAASASFRSDGLHSEVLDGFKNFTPADLDGTPFHESYVHVGPNPDQWAELVSKVIELDRTVQDWPPADIAAIASPTMLIAADGDIVRLEHTLEMFHLLGGGGPADLDGLPDARLAIAPGTTHVGIPGRAAMLVPMMNEFLDAELAGRSVGGALG